VRTPIVYKYTFRQITGSNIFTLLLCLIFPALFTSCALSPTEQTRSKVLYQAPTPTSFKTNHIPAFLIEESDEQYNRIGMPSVRESANQKPEIYVDPEKPAVFFETQQFSTNRGTYQNLIYRIHFEKVPFSFGTFNITAGNNPGALIIYTLDANDQLLLITTVHTCGCFLAFLPTKALPRGWFPADWPQESQWVYGHTLPSLLKPSETNESKKIVFTLESETHRVSDVAVLENDTSQNSHELIDMEIFPMSDLYFLPYKDTTESFFELEGSRRGYVRNNTKFLERLLISWWAFDLYVGEDKAFGSADTSDTILYTSLKFWDRKESDLKNFPRFLSYWGWKL
jgi:hypothetical protein